MFVIVTRSILESSLSSMLVSISSQEVKQK